MLTQRKRKIHFKNDFLSLFSKGCIIYAVEKLITQKAPHIYEMY